MRINKWIAKYSGLGRRTVDDLITQQKVFVDGVAATLGQEVIGTESIMVDGKPVHAVQTSVTTILMNKPVGYVCSRDGQGSKTVYDLLPEDLHNLKPVGRLDKDSSGLLLLTNVGELANKLTHPSFEKEKVYEVVLDKPLTGSDQHKIKQGVMVETYVSRLRLQKLETDKHQVTNSYFLVTLTEGKNRQIRRTFSALKYDVKRLYRIQFGPYRLGKLKPRDFVIL